MESDIHNSQFWMHSHYGTIENKQNRTKQEQKKQNKTKKQKNKNKNKVKKLIIL